MTDNINLIAQKTIFQVRFNPQIRLLNRLPDLFHSVSTETYDNIKAGPGKLVVIDQKFHRGYSAEINNLNYLQDAYDKQLAKEGIDKLCFDILPNTELQHFSRFGYLKRFSYSVDKLAIQFDQLVEIMNLKFFSQDKALTSVLPKVGDVMYRVDSADENNKIRLTVGPTKKEQLNNLIQFDPEFFEAKNSPKDYVAAVERLPNTSVYFEIDVIREDESLTMEEISPFREFAENRFTKITSGITRYLLEGA